MNKTDFSLYKRAHLQSVISESTSISEVLRKLGVSDYGSAHTKLTNFLKNSDFDTSTLVGRRIKRYDSTGIPKKTLSERLSINSTRNTNYIKRRLIREGVKENKCERCGITEWMDDDLIFELHHINGNNSDNRLENLILLCPNCHSQTSNFRGKNSSIDLEFSEIAKQTADSKMEYLLKKEEERKNEILQNHLKKGHNVKINSNKRVVKYCAVCGKELNIKSNKYCSYECRNKDVAKNIPTKEVLLEEAFNHKSLESFSKVYNVSSNGCKKWLKKYGIYDEIKKRFKQISYPVCQFDLDGNLIKCWHDASEIEKVLGYKKTNIRQACCGLQETSHGYIWKYKKDL